MATAIEYFESRPAAEQLYVAPSGKEYQLREGVYVNTAIAEEDLNSFEINPVVEQVRGLGRVTLEAVRFTQNGLARHEARVHRLYGIELNGFKQAAELTDPLDDDPSHVIDSYAGLSEHIQGRIRKQFHTAISDYHPKARVVSVETDGIGGIGDHYDVRNKNEREKHGHMGMALSRLALAKALGGKLGQVLVGTSQGSVIAHRMVMENSFGKPVNGKINIIGLVGVSPALVDPSRTRLVMNDLFLAKFMLNVGEELVLRSSPLEILDAVRSVGAFKLPRRDIQAIRYQISQLRKGTPEADVLKAIQKLPTLVIEGTDDAVGEQQMYERLEADPNSQLHVVRIKGRGHELAMKPYRLMDKLARTTEYQKFFTEAARKGDRRRSKRAA